MPIRSPHQRVVGRCTSHPELGPHDPDGSDVGPGMGTEYLVFFQNRRTPSTAKGRRKIVRRSVVRFDATIEARTEYVCMYVCMYVYLLNCT